MNEFMESQVNIPSNHSTSLTLVHIYPDTDCDIYLFGEIVGTIQKNDFYKLMLPKGEHIFKFVSITDKTIFSEQILEVDESPCVVKVNLEQKIAEKRKKIEYTTSDGHKLHLRHLFWNTNIIDHTYCNGKGTITCREDITEIIESAFFGCRNLLSITIPNSVNSIGYRAFCDCQALTSIEIPDNVIKVGDEVFAGCTNLSAFYGKYATADNRCWIVDGELRAFASAGLTTYTIPSSVTKIGNSALYGSKLIDITIPNTITSIEKGAFEYCNKLTSISIPSSITKIGGSAFYGCDCLKEVYITNLKTWCEIDFNSGYYTGNPLSNGAKLYLNGELVTNLVISDNITKISAKAFCGCSSLINIIIHNSVSSIEINAFENCSNLTNVIIGNCVTSIGPGAFYGCDKLGSVIIGDGVSKIYDSAFGNCINLSSICMGNSVNELGSFVFSGCNNLNSITIPASLTSIGAEIFKDCFNLVCVYCNPILPPKVSPHTSQGLGLANNAIIYVTKEAFVLYKNAQKWNEYNISIF